MTFFHGALVGITRSGTRTSAGADVARATAPSLARKSTRAKDRKSPICGSRGSVHASSPRPRIKTIPFASKTGQARSDTGWRYPTSTATPPPAGKNVVIPGVVVVNARMRGGSSGTRITWRRIGAGSKAEGGGHSPTHTSPSTRERTK